jgi:hypothetical protein
MSFPTSPAFIIQSAKGWEDEYRVHPIMAWMHDYEKAFDFGDMKASDSHLPWHTEDFTFQKPDGTTTTDAASSWAALKETYAPFSAHYHEPVWVVIFEHPEIEGGYVLMGRGTIFGKFVVPREGSAKVRDMQGREWEFGGAGAFYFEYVKDEAGPKGMKLKTQKIYADGVGLVGEMLKRGMVKPEQILG